MDRKWSKVTSPEEEAEIPRLPTREEELAYLDKFESELRNRSYYDSGFPPDPSRKYITKMDYVDREVRAKRYRELLLYGAILSPVSFWLADKAPAKSCPSGIPYRMYPMQHKVRFWSFFLLFEATLTFGAYYLTISQKELERSMWPLNKIRERQL